MKRTYSSTQVALPRMNTGFVRHSPTAQKTVVDCLTASMKWWFGSPLWAQDLLLAV